MKMKYVYFAHPLTHYYTELELKCERRIRDYINNAKVVNPNQKWISNIYLNRKANGCSDPFAIFKEMVDACDIVVGVTFMDGILGAGVHTECMRGYATGKKVFILKPDTLKFFPFNTMWESLSIKETKENTKLGVL